MKITNENRKKKITNENHYWTRHVHHNEFTNCRAVQTNDGELGCLVFGFFLSDQQ